jgi:hypothetical protein
MEKLNSGNKWKVIFSLNRLPSLIGGMSIFASIFEVLNIGRLLEAILSFSATFAFGFEVITVFVITITFEFFIDKVSKKKSK